MPPVEALDDDYVIDLLKREAAVNKSRPGAAGFGLLPGSEKRRAKIPKPNTRFLKNLVREADIHNASLKAKEDEERRVRFGRDLRDAKRKREGVNADTGKDKRRCNGERPSRWLNALSGLDGVSDGRRSRLDHAKDRSEKARLGEHRKSGNTRHSRDEKRLQESRDDTKHTDVLPIPIPISPIGRDGHTRRVQDRLENENLRSLSGSPARTKRIKKRPRSLDGSESDSDSSQAIFGPAPPPITIPRGRGAFRQSHIDFRFASEYDPRTDVSLDQENGDRDEWDMALEALRDRARWRAQGADRLRAAGFTEDEVVRWEKAEEKDVEDVRWSAKGARREWDRGKILDKDGNVELKATWTS